MQRIPLDARRRILQLKFKGLSNAEVAERVDVSKGTVANVLEEAREGRFPELEDLADQIDGLLELGKRLDETDLTLSAAHSGLDVISWLDELSVSPAHIASFVDRLKEIESDEISAQAYCSAAIRLRSVERATGYQFDGELESLLAFFEDYETEDIDQLGLVADRATDLEGGPEALESAIDQALEMQEIGFSPDLAADIATEFAAIRDDSQEDAIDALREIYEEYSSVERAVEEKTEVRNGLDDEITELRETRDLLQRAVGRLDSSLSTQEETLEELKATREELQSEIDDRRDRVAEMRDTYDELQHKMVSLDRERDVVHAYRKFLRDKTLTKTLLDDLGYLLDIRDGNAAHLEPRDESIRDRFRSELIKEAKEMMEGEEMMLVAEHEQKLDEALDVQRDLEELEAERDAVLAFYDFLETEKLDKQLLKDLYDIKRGLSSAPIGEDRKSREVREFMQEQVDRFTEGVQTIGLSKYRANIDMNRQRYIRVIDSVDKSFQTLAREVEGLQSVCDDQWQREVVDQIASRIDTDADLSQEAIEMAVREALDDEIDRRVERKCEERVRSRFRKTFETDENAS